MRLVLRCPGFRCQLSVDDQFREWLVRSLMMNADRRYSCTLYYLGYKIIHRIAFLARKTARPESWSTVCSQFYRQGLRYEI